MPWIRRSRVWREITPPAGRKIPCFCTNHLHSVQKKKQSHAAGGESAVRSGTCLICMPTVYLLSDNISYAVGFKPGICLDLWPDSPPAGWKRTSLFIHMLHCVQHVYEQAKTSPMLPPANYIGIGNKRPVWTHIAYVVSGNTRAAVTARRHIAPPAGKYYQHSHFCFIDNGCHPGYSKQSVMKLCGISRRYWCRLRNISTKSPNGSHSDG
jgi:hypothetical protein